MSWEDNEREEGKKDQYHRKDRCALLRRFLGRGFYLLCLSLVERDMTFMMGFCLA